MGLTKDYKWAFMIHSVGLAKGVSGLDHDWAITRAVKLAPDYNK